GVALFVAAGALLPSIGCQLSAVDSTDGGTDAGGAPCDGRGICDQCEQCVNDQGLCTAQLAACAANPSCGSLTQCLLDLANDLSCSNDPTCKAQTPATCREDFPEGTNDYDVAALCVFCAECPADCHVRYDCPQ